MVFCYANGTTWMARGSCMPPRLIAGAYKRLHALAPKALDGARLMRHAKHHHAVAAALLRAHLRLQRLHTRRIRFLGMQDSCLPDRRGMPRAYIPRQQADMPSSHFPLHHRDLLHSASQASTHLFHPPPLTYKTWDLLPLSPARASRAFLTPCYPPGRRFLRKHAHGRRASGRGRT